MPKAAHRRPQNASSFVPFSVMPRSSTALVMPWTRDRLSVKTRKKSESGAWMRLKRRFVISSLVASLYCTKPITKVRVSRA